MGQLQKILIFTYYQIFSLLINKTSLYSFHNQRLA